MPVHDVLRRFSQKQASVDESMRALVSYDSWFAPVLWASEVFATNVFDDACLLGNASNLPPGKLWLFTDMDAGLRSMADGATAGPYGGPLRGSPLFAHLPEGIETLEVNPGSPPEQGWCMGAKAIPLARAWGRAITLERAVERGDASFARALGNHEEYGVLITASGAIATAVGAAGMKNPGLIFTAADCMEAGRRRLGGGADLRPGIVAGATLFKDLDALGVDGYILNVGGIGPTRAYDREVCAAIAELVAGDVEARRLRTIADDRARRT